MRGRLSRFLVALVASSAALAGCVQGVNPHLPPPPRNAQLPQGWVWPHSGPPISPAPVAVVPGVQRPFDANALMAITQPKGCTPFELTPGFWVTPTCGLPDILASLAVPFRARTTAFGFNGSGQPLPVAADLRNAGLDGPVKDQQQTGVCWSFAMSTIMENGLRRAGNMDVVAPLHLVASDAFAKLFTLGKSDRAYTQEVVWPYEPVKACKFESSPDSCEQAYHVQAGTAKSDPVLMAEFDRANKAGAYTITKVEKLGAPLKFDEIAEVIASGRAPYLSINIDHQGWKATGGVIQDYVSEDRGSHAVVGVGFRTSARGREVLVHNSWGTGWGEGGYAWITEAMLARHGNSAFVVEVGQGPGGQQLPSVQGLPGFPANLPFPFPLPSQPAQSGGGCAAGQVKDALLGTCTNACPNGQSPFAGFCTSGGGQSQTPPPAQPQQGCAQGQVMDWGLQRCSPACKNGLPPFAGTCLP